MLWQVRRPWQMKHNGNGLPCYPARFPRDLFWCFRLETALLGRPAMMTETPGAMHISVQESERTAAFALVLGRPDSGSCPNIIASDLHWMTWQGQEGISSFAKWSLQGPQGCWHALWLYNIESSSLPASIFPSCPSNAIMAHKPLPCALCARPPNNCAFSYHTKELEKH